MRRPKAMPLIFLVLCCLSSATPAHAQANASSLRPAQPVERAITRGQVQSYHITLEQNQFLKLVVEQRGIDVVVRLFSPEGRSMGEFDSPNGTSGPEEVAVVSEAAGLYRIDVLPLESAENEPSGRYEIKVLEVRAASGAELESIRKRESARAKSPALLAEVAAGLQQIRLPETRVRLQVQAAQLLFNSDEKLARKLVEDAAEGVREYLAGVEASDQNYYQSFQVAMQLRNEVAGALAQSNPELALSFLRSTRTLADPSGVQAEGQPSQELQFELSLAAQVAPRSSKLALTIAEESLKRGYSYNFVEALMRLQSTDPEAAARLANALADKLQGENLLKNQAASSLALNLLQLARPQPVVPSGGEQKYGLQPELRPGLLPEQKYRELFSKALSAALSYTPASVYSTERNSAQNLLNSIKGMTQEMERYAPERAQLVEKRSTELNTPPDPQSQLWQKYQDAANNGSLDEALEEISQAPAEMKEQFYQQVAQRALQAGDFTRARQILNDYIKSPFQRQQAVANLERQAIYYAISKGNIDEALRAVSNLPRPSEQARMLIQMAEQLASSQKRATLMRLLERARLTIGGNGRAEDQEQMNVLIELARVFLRFDSKRSSEIMEPLVDQFNEMNVAAAALNGFGQQFYKEGELLMQNGNSLGNIANQLINTLGTVASTDFDRAKATADKIQRPEVRLSAYLAIAQQNMGQRLNERAIRYSSFGGEWRR